MGHLFIATLFFINVPVVNMRVHPDPTSEVVSQAYYSEEVKILEENREWVKIETVVDHYGGWVPQNVLFEQQTPLFEAASTVIKIKRCAAHVYHVEDTLYGPILTLPFESRLEVMELPQDPTSRWLKVRLMGGREAYIQRGDVTFDTSLLQRDAMCALSFQFIALPYTWGGRSSFGYDCSGFVQMLYRQMGIYLPRDAKDQAAWKGSERCSEKDLIPGDLVFWGHKADQIRHVGLYLGEGEFIHATVRENAPYIRVSRLSDPEWNGLGFYPYRTYRKFIQKS